MRRANGEGSIFKLSGKRRKPWAVRITVDWTDGGRQLYRYLGYYSSKTEARSALNAYNVNPYNLMTKDVTLKDVYDKWVNDNDLAEKTLYNYGNSFKSAKPIHKVPMRDIKIMQLEQILNTMTTPMQNVFKNVMKQLYVYAMKHEIVDKNIIDLISIKANKSKERIPFTIEEINKIKSFKHKHTDTILILLYSGMRIMELLEMEVKNVNLEERYMIGGKKTEAGKNRIIPIHDEIYFLIKARCEKNHKFLIHHDDGRKINYRSYRTVFWDRMLTTLNIEHTPHDCRHTFASFADRVNMNKVALKRIMGHSLKDMTEHYTHKDMEELLSEINKIKY